MDRDEGAKISSSPSSKTSCPPLESSLTLPYKQDHTGCWIKVDDREKYPAIHRNILLDMEGQGQLVRSRVVRVNSEESWDLYVNEANNQGCPVIVHFSASWCAPSVAMNPFFQELAHSFQDVFFMMVDVDDVQAVAKRMDVKAMPTFVLLKEGKVEMRLVGANPEEIRKRVASFLISNRPIAVV